MNRPGQSHLKSTGTSWSIWAESSTLVNTIHLLFLADEDKFLLTPTYHVFAMYAAHQGAQAVRAVTSAPSVHWNNTEDREQSL